MYDSSSGAIAKVADKSLQHHPCTMVDQSTAQAPAEPPPVVTRPKPKIVPDEIDTANGECDSAKTINYHL